MRFSDIESHESGLDSSGISTLNMIKHDSHSLAISCLESSQTKLLTETMRFREDLERDLHKVDFMDSKRRLSIPLLSQLPKMSVAEIQAALTKQRELAKLGVQVDALHEAVMQRRNTVSGCTATGGNTAGAGAVIREDPLKRWQETQAREFSESNSDSSVERSKHPKISRSKS